MELLNIKNFENIGDSLSAININFDLIDSYIHKLNINTDKFLIPYINFFKQNENRLSYLIDILYDKIPNWDIMASYVTSNSAKWIKPIVFIDSTIYRFPNSNLQTTTDFIIENFKKIYPIFTNLENNPTPNYIENQKAIIYYYVNHIHKKTISEDITNSDIANCVSEGTKTAILTCQDKINFDKTYCNGRELTCLGCGGTSCQQSVSVTCVYPETKTPTSNRYIQAIIRNNFEDISEKEIKTIFLKIKNCEWVVERIL